MNGNAGHVRSPHYLGFSAEFSNRAAARGLLQSGALTRARSHGNHFEAGLIPTVGGRCPLSSGSTFASLQVLKMIPMQTIKRALWSTLTLCASAGLLPACIAEIDDTSSEEARGNITVSRQAITNCGNPKWGCCDSALYSSCDAVLIGQRSQDHDVELVFKLYTCPTTPSSTTPSSTCRVEDGFYLIGGGAATLGRMEAALKRSIPSSVASRGSWGARSEGILGPVSHGLRTYAIGLKMIDLLSGEDVNLDNDVHSYSVNSNLGERVTASTTVPSGQLLIGGGWSAGSGTFAVDAYATGMSRGTWTVNGQQFGTTTGQILGRAIGLSRCLPAANPIFCLPARDITEAVSPGGTTIQGAIAQYPDSFQAMVGVGVKSSSWSRPIWMMYPLAYTDGNTAVGFTTAPTGASGHVTTQILTVGF
jgi:hypothetical protein